MGFLNAGATTKKPLGAGGAHSQPSRTCVGEMAAPQKKSVLVQFGEFNHVVTFETSDECTERQCFLAEVRRVFSERIGGEDRLTLQTQEDDWGGVFVDCFSDSIKDKSRLKLVVEKSEVSLLKNICEIRAADLK